MSVGGPRTWKEPPEILKNKFLKNKFTLSMKGYIKKENTHIHMHRSESLKIMLTCILSFSVNVHTQLPLPVRL